MVEHSELIDKEVKIVFEDPSGTRIFLGILKEVANSHFTILTEGKLQMFPSNRVIRIEVVKKLEEIKWE